MSTPVTAAYYLERAWVGGAVVHDVRVEISDGRFIAVEPTTRARAGDVRLEGLTLPGIANCHSHAFHRALRGRTQRERGTFWTWRDQMYRVAEVLQPDSYHALALAAYREMALAGYTAVGEFHYLHHQPDGTPYADPNAMGVALIAAAREAGLRIALLDTCYLSSGFGAPVEGAQVRYSDGSAHRWADRVTELAERFEGHDDVRIGAAIHSVRAVPREGLAVVAAWARAHGTPLHVHLSEQPRENEACLQAYGLTPTALLAEAGALGPAMSAVHATHLTDDDIAALGAASVFACFCATTERDLGDGIGPSRQLQAAGARLTVGSDSHAVVDPWEELRAVELDERLATVARGHWSAAELLDAGSVHGHASLGFSDAGAIEVGARADLVTIDTGSPRTAGAGSDDATVVFAASAADVRQTIVGGRIVARSADAGRIGHDLVAAVAAVTGPTVGQERP